MSRRHSDVSNLTYDQEENMTAAVNRGFVLDIEGEELPHPNGAGHFRILVRLDTAQDLFDDLDHALTGD